MNIQELQAEVEKMSPEERKALLETQFPEELEKEAEAALDSSELANALYVYGGLRAERAVAEADGLDKVAAEDLKEHEELEREVGEALERLVESTGIAEHEDPAELHKEAQAAGGIVFQGYVDALEKMASDDKGKGRVRAMLDKAKAAAGKAGAHLKSHKGKYALGAGALGAAGAAYAAKKHMDKKASDATVGDIVQALTDRDMAIVSAQEVEEGWDELEKVAEGRAAALAAKLKGKARAVGEHLKARKSLYGAGAGGAAGGFIAGRLSKKGKD